MGQCGHQCFVNLAVQFSDGGYCLFHLFNRLNHILWRDHSSSLFFKKCPDYGFQTGSLIKALSNYTIPGCKTHRIVAGFMARKRTDTILQRKKYQAIYKKTY